MVHYATPRAHMLAMAQAANGKAPLALAAAKDAVARATEAGGGLSAEEAALHVVDDPDESVLLDPDAEGPDPDGLGPLDDGSVDERADP